LEKSNEGCRQKSCFNKKRRIATLKTKRKIAALKAVETRIENMAKLNHKI
jgi:hypothetical protein